MIVTSLVFLGNHTKNYFGCHGYIPGHEFIPTEIDFLQHKKITIFKMSLKKKSSINFLFFSPFLNIQFVYNEISENRDWYIFYSKINLIQS